MNAAAISTRRWNHLLLCVLLFASMLWIALPLGAEESANPELSPVMLRLKEMEAYKNHNFKEALDIYQQLLLDTKNTSQTTPTDLGRAIVCLAQLSRLKETDMLLEKTVEVHADNWKMLREAATIYKDKLLNHDGVLVEGKFERGSHRGQDKYANAVDRDRVRALQLYVQAMKAAEKTKATKDDGLSDLYKEMELALQMGRSGQNNSWELQTLSDLTTLPDYEEGYHYGRGGGTQGAPVNEKGNPVFYNVPQSFESAQNDGERWRWCLDKMVRLDAGRRNYANSRLADFLRQQFDVQTLAEYSWFKRAPSDDDKKDESGTYAMHTLGEDETIAKLAVGVRRFKLPDDQNFIKLYRENKNYRALAEIFQNRRQYDKALEMWRVELERIGNVEHGWRKVVVASIDQIEKNWGQFEPVMSQPTSENGATVEYRFRNGKQVQFEAYEVKVKELLDDVKEYIESNPKQLSWEKMNINDIGWMLVAKNQTKYIGEKAATWAQTLEPRAGHFDKRITVQTPLKKAGAYLLKGNMDKGNESRVLIWVTDTAIVKKPLSEKAMYYVADAVSGKPLDGAPLNFFGWYQEYKGDNKTEIHVKKFTEKTNADGMVITDAGKQAQNNYQWLVTAADGKRFAFLGFSNVWYNRIYDEEYNQSKAIVMTDRPVYRPNQTVKFKAWLCHANYDQENISTGANRDFAVEIYNPKHDKVLAKTFKTDEFGGFDGELALPADAALGVYYISLPSQSIQLGGNTFRVEEYKKPEFEVTVEAPKEPVALGETISATVKAKYYFGSPVTKAKVKVKVTRTDRATNWYPGGVWDWFYGRGYWWFAYDYAWYPGWHEWGCKRPAPWWWTSRSNPPEIVMELEKEIGTDGTFKVDIDTALAKAVHGDTDHEYSITAEVTDESRRTIVGSGNVIAARKPFKVYAWVDRGHYRLGDTVHADFSAQTVDNKPVSGKGELHLYKVTYAPDKKKGGALQPVEKPMEKWNLDTNAEGRANVQIKASAPGQYRLSYKVKDEKTHEIEGGYVFTVMGEGKDDSDYRFNDIEIVPDKKEYKAGDKARVRINVNKKGGTVLLFVRASNGIYPEPKVLRLSGKSVVEEIEITKKEMPNFFIEAVTVADGRLYSEAREIVVPPEQRVLNLEVTPSKTEYKPGEAGKVQFKLTDLDGKPYQGSLALTMYDKSVEYISGGSNVPEIKAFFWKWRRHHNPTNETSLERRSGPLSKENEVVMRGVGVFGDTVADESAAMGGEEKYFNAKGGASGGSMRELGMVDAFVARPMMAKSASKSVSDMAMPAPAAAPMVAGAMAEMSDKKKESSKDDSGPAEAEAGESPEATATVRSNFADTALWVATLNTNHDGLAETTMTMPENLTGWKIKTWAMGHGTKVAESSVEVVTKKNLLLRMQAPRFFTEKDEVVLSANIHNYLNSKKDVRVVLELDGKCLESMGMQEHTVTEWKGRKIAVTIIHGGVEKTISVEANSEQRVDWIVKAVHEGEATVRMKALTNEESDAMEMKFPVQVHGMDKMVAKSGYIAPDKNGATITFDVPEERRPEASRLELRFSPTLAGAMVDAIPYLVDYPYGCTEQTLSRFLPTVMTQRVLQRLGIPLAEIEKKRTNLNAQELGDPKERAKQWKRYRNWDGSFKTPVFDEAEVSLMAKEGVKKLTEMQLTDGGWGWFSGFGEHSWPHTTAYVVHGLQIAKENDLAVDANVIKRGLEWLTKYQGEQVQLLKNYEKKDENIPKKKHADDLDAFVFMTLTDAGIKNDDMCGFLYRDRGDLAVYAKSMLGMALHKLDRVEERDMVIQNIEQFLVKDDENQTAYLNLNNGAYWWCWYGSEYEAHAYYLKLLAKTGRVTDWKAPYLVKYLLNNRKNATYWNSTRDTAVVIEAFADYLKASKEDAPDMTVTISETSRGPVKVLGKADEVGGWIEGDIVTSKTVHITSENLFTFDNQFLIKGDAVKAGKRTITIKKEGKGPLYFNAYLSYFSLEDFITSAGLEVKVKRNVYKLTEADKKIKVAGAHGQALDQKVEKYDRALLDNHATLKSGDLVEVELVLESKNDYEYLIFEDMKAAGFEPVEVKSGYTGNEMGAYVEFRDNRVAFFTRQLARGKHSVSYRLRAEIPGKFSALPAKGYAMYAPELRGNSDEIKINITD